MATDVAKKIRNHYTSYSKGQKRIANFILENYDKAAYMTAAKLGRTANVSESTVVRFAYKIGFDSYSEFQKAVQELVRTRLTPNQRIEFTKQRIGKGDILENVMEADISKIRYTIDKINRNAFYYSVDAILAAKTIYIMGARSSEAVARILYYNLSLIFDNVKFVNPTSSAEVFEQMLSIGKNDVLFAFSFPRYSLKMVSAVKYAKNNGAKVVVCTDSEISPLVEHASYVLTAQSDMASFMDSLVAPVSIINAIIVEITNKREKEIRKRFDTLEQVWDEYEVYTKH